MSYNPTRALRNGDLSTGPTLAPIQIIANLSSHAKKPLAQPEGRTSG
jgi:hypothetical protein